MDTELAGTSHQSAATGAVINNLLMRVIPRSFVGSRFVCQAQGSPLIEPVSKEVTIQMHCKWDRLLYFILFIIIIIYKSILFSENVEHIAI